MMAINKFETLAKINKDNAKLLGYISLNKPKLNYYEEWQDVNIYFL
jgi:hypothetical protein